MNKEKQEKKIPVVGQRWRDNDSRFPNRVRELLILEKVPNVGYHAFKCLVYADRFKPTATGYKYVGEGAP